MPLLNRLDRVAEELRKEICQIVLFELTNTQLGFITITRCTVSPDLQYCKVYMTVLGDEETIKKNLKILNDASGYIHHALVKRIKIRYIPFISFHFDESVEKERRLSELFTQIEKEIKVVDQKPPAPALPESQPEEVAIKPEPKPKTKPKIKAKPKSKPKPTKKKAPTIRKRPANKTKK